MADREVLDVDAAIAAAREEDPSTRVAATTCGVCAGAITWVVDDDTGQEPPRWRHVDQAASYRSPAGAHRATPETPPNPVDESGMYRVDPDQPRNIYLGKTYVGVMFDPDVAEQVVRALNGSARGLQDASKETD